MNKKTLKKSLAGFMVVAVLPMLAMIFSANLAQAETNPVYYHIITLEQGWNIISTPRLVESHEFSASESTENFDIFLLDSENPAGWSTMQDLGQTEFAPLYGYFVNNKTGNEQTLTLNYRTDTEPNERLFMRELNQGWNVVGVANPSYTLRQKEGNDDDTNNINPILKSLSNNNSIDFVLDFTADQIEKSSVKIGEQWDAKVFYDASQMNDFRETKAYAIYLNSAGTYQGFQNDDSVKIYDPVVISSHSSEWKSVPKNTNDVVLIDFTISTGYPIDITFNNLVIDINGDNLVNADIKDLELICSEEVKWSNALPVIGDNEIDTSFSLNAGTTECKIIIDITNNPTDYKNMQAVLKDINNASKLNIIGNSLRYSEHENDITGYHISITNEHPLSINRQWTGGDNKLTKNSVSNNLMKFNFYVNQAITIEEMTVNLEGDYLQDSDIENLELVCDSNLQWTVLNPTVGDNVVADSISFDKGNYNCQLRIDITDNPDGNEKIKATFKNPNNQNYWIISNSSNNIVDNIYPSNDINGEEHKILIPSLTIESYGFGETNLIGGQTNVDIISFNFMAGEASDVTVDSIELNAYLSDIANTLTFTADEKGASSGVEEVLINISIYDNSHYNNPILLATESLTVGQDDVSVTFDNLNWIIPSWENKQLLVKADIANSGPINGNNDTIAIAIESANNILSTDNSANNVVPTILNGNTNPDHYKIVKAFGSLNMGSSWNPSQIVVAGTNDVLYATVDFWASNEDFVIDRLRIVNDRYDYVSDDEFVNIILEDDNGTEIATANLVNGKANFSGLNIYVSENEQTLVYIKADLNTVANGADSGDYTSLKIDYNENFRATGQDSGHTIISVGFHDTYGSDMYVYKSMPTIMGPQSNGTLISGYQTLFEFDIIADLNGDIGWKKSIFSVMKDSSVIITNPELYDTETGTVVDATITASLLNGGDTSGNIIVVVDDEQTVNAGSTKTYRLRAMIENVSTVSYVSTSINQSTVYYAEPSDYVTVALTDASFLWSDKSAENHSEITFDWNGDYLIRDLPVSQTLLNN